MTKDLIRILQITVLYHLEQELSLNLSLNNQTSLIIHPLMKSCNLIMKILKYNNNYKTKTHLNQMIEIINEISIILNKLWLL